jgi:HK97 family phage prohead protease
MPSEKRTTTIGVCERRVATVGAAVLQQRAAGQEPAIEGHGALFNTETVIGGYFREVIAPGAFKDSIAQDDIRVAFNHDPNFILGRTSAKTATVEEDKKGLKYTAIPPDTQAGRDTVTSIKRGDITGSSFQFTVENDDDESWDFEQTKQGKLPLRTIKRAKLYEVGPVAFPAYDTTTVSARALVQVEAARALAEGAAARVTTTDEPAAEEQAELITYRGMQTLLTQLGAAQAEAAALVAALVADETETPTETDAEEAGEEEVEGARLGVLIALAAQMRGVIEGFAGLAQTALTDEDDDETPPARATTAPATPETPGGRRATDPAPTTAAALPAPADEARTAPRVDLADFRRHLASLEAQCQ